jgi:hypothetical protein
MLKANKKLLNDICEDSSCHYSGEYCIFKEMILSMGIADRTLIQLKCVEKFKYEESERQKKDIGWQSAWLMWVELEYAKKFSIIYDENPEATFKEIFKKVTEKI